MVESSQRHALQRRPSNRCMGMVFALIFWLSLLAVVARESNDVNAFEMLPPRSRSESTARLVGFFSPSGMVVVFAWVLSTMHAVFFS